jgi:hypothetical protein
MTRRVSTCNETETVSSIMEISEVRSDVCRDRSIAHNSANSRRFDERILSAAGKRDFAGRDKGAETATDTQSPACRDKMRRRIPASSGLFAMNREISVCVRLRGGAGRTRTSNQTIISRVL